MSAYDLTFSAPKSVSLLFGLGNAETTAAVRAAHDTAALQALGYLERSAAAVRRGHGGVVIEATDGLIAAPFRHRSSRAGDPQLHTHVVVANLGQGTDGRWTALDGRRLFAHATTASHPYQAVLRAELSRALGVRWMPVARGIAEVDGIPTQVLRAFSRRRAEIEAALAEHGTSGPKAAEAAAVATRRQKDRGVDPIALVAEWKHRAGELGWAVEGVAGAGAARTETETSLDREALRTWLVGPEGLTAQGSTFTRRDVVRAVAGALPSDAPMTAVSVELFADGLLRDAEVVPMVDTDDGTRFRRRDGRLMRTGDEERRFTTRELLVTEQRLIAAVEIGNRAGRGVGHHGRTDSRLSDEQRQAVTALVGGGDAIAVLAGRAGTGKTFALAAAREAWERAGVPVLGAAVARRAAHELERGAGIPSTSVAALLSNLARRPDRLPAGAVVAIDEAGMLGTRDLAKLADLVEAASGKLVLVGDHGQLPEIEAGGVFHALVRRGHATELRENRRQVNAWERTAIDHLRDGRAPEAVAIYATHDRIHLKPDGQATRQRIVEDWSAAHGDAVMVAARRSDVADLNRRARAVVRGAGRLGTDELRVAGRVFSAGDRIVIRRNDSELEVHNGDRGTIVSVNIRRGRLDVDLAGRRVEVGANFLRSRTPTGECPIQHAYANHLPRSPRGHRRRCLRPRRPGALPGVGLHRTHARPGGQAPVHLLPDRGRTSRVRPTRHRDHTTRPAHPARRRPRARRGQDPRPRRRPVPVTRSRRDARGRTQPMTDSLVAALLRALVADPEAVRTLRSLMEPAGEQAPPAPAYTTALLGRCTGLGEKAIRNAMTRGELQARKRGGRWVITLDDVEAWLGPPEGVERRHARRHRRGGPLNSVFSDLDR